MNVVVDDQKKWQMMDIDKSITATKECIQSALLKVSSSSSTDGSSANCKNNIIVPSIFTDEGIIRRPPFTYIHALVKFFVEQTSSLGCWTELLFRNNNFTMKNDDSLDSLITAAESEEEEDGHQSSSLLLTRKEKLTFITRLLSLVSHVTGRKFDVLISPSKILCGQDVILTHQLLSAFATIIVTTTRKDNDDDETNNTISNAAKYVLEIGDVNLYKRGVRTRKAFTCMQAICRGWLVRQKYHKDKKVSLVEKMKQCNEATIDEGMAAVVDDIHDEEGECSNSSNVKEDESGSIVQTQQNAPSKSSKSKGQELLESYEAMLSRKVKVEEEIHMAEKRLKRENDKLIRMLNLSLVHKTRTNNNNSYAEMPPPPKSAPSIGRNIGNTMVKNVSHGNIDMTFADTITNFSERQRAMKQKERRMDERESRLKQKFARSKQKEADLKHQETRVSDLANKIRNQQIQLKEQKLQFERSKLLEDETTNTSLETTRPCLLCTEKKIQLREIRTKLRQRNRVLSQREANLIERAHELRRREMQLVKREQSSKEQQSTSSVTEEESTCPELSEPSPPLDTQQCQSLEEKTEPIKKTTLPVVVRREASSNPPPRKRHPRKRRRRSREGRTGRTNEIYINRKSMTPIVEEETPSNEQENEHGVQQNTVEIDGTVGDDIDIGQCSVEKRVQDVACDSEIIDIKKARESLGIIKSKRNDALQSNRKQQGVEQTTTTTAKAQIPTATKRRVFAFEEQSKRLPPSDSHRPSNSALPRPSIRQSTRERDRRRPTQKQHGDDWISNFDSQMKCAINRLSELV